MKLRIQTTDLQTPTGRDDGTKYASLLLMVDDGDEWQQYAVPFVITTNSTPDDCWRQFQEGIAKMDEWLNR